MQYQIYIGLLFFVVISPCQSMESVSLHNSISNIQKNLEWLGELLEKQEREAIRKNERSFSVPKEIQPIIEKIFPDSTSIYTIKDVLENIEKNNYTGTANIIPKLKQFKENEYISLLNFLQILADKYFKIPKQMVELFNNLFEGFHDKDTLKTRLISLDDFKSVLENVLKNDDIKKNILKAFKDIENVYYEAWLLKKRKDINSMIFRPHIMKFSYKEDKHMSNSRT
ncbi:uncharacterized protein LOC126906535 isoform X2 [Daktulosphaira vitifoliae]|uniref:uncharacterized protein LOC126906535 isoform X2 n=1 Tax=Daktulosphaira vitifoliae TaxID=58002 RepID=UPI0021AA188C|nr:uncharacterized protein LOC126906535 isoform X2 [Daktulosphaira vitifoliae]